MARDVPTELARELSVVYFPQLGYLVTVAQLDDAVDTASFAEIGWTYQVRITLPQRTCALTAELKLRLSAPSSPVAQFMTESQAYFKNEKCRDMDRHLGDLQCFIAGAPPSSHSSRSCRACV